MAAYVRVSTDGDEQLGSFESQKKYYEEKISSTPEWHASGVRGIIKNEKYKGVILLGKTYTVDPISKRRLENFGEEERYYIEDHHEPIVSKEVLEKAREIREGQGIRPQQNQSRCGSA